MFGDYLLERTAAKYNNRILLLDDDLLDAKMHYGKDFIAHGFRVIYYKDDLDFRVSYDEALHSNDEKIVVIADTKKYIPYDVRRRLRVYSIGLSEIFPKLNAEVLKERSDVDLELLCMAYAKNFEDLSSKKQTEEFMKQKVLCKENIEKYVMQTLENLLTKAKVAGNYKEWMAIAEEKAKVDLLAAKNRLNIDTSEINCLFRDYVLKNFGKLSTEMSKETPILVSRAMEYMHDNSEKFIIVVMDGMSEFDWKILSDRFNGIKFEQQAVFAMIPSTTSISRQCLLSNKYPSQLIEPWKQSKEKAEFLACAKELGYSDTQVEYQRGYDSTFGSFVRCGAVIINDIDDMVHAQHQGRLGMYNDIGLLAEQEKLKNMVHRFIIEGFDVYITADHGNTPCTGLGKLMGTGVELETKSRRMLVLQNYANKESLIEKYELIEYPKYYLKKDFDYLICDVGDSLNAKCEDVMTHGGISIDEVIVPFIKVKAGMNNG